MSRRKTAATSIKELPYEVLLEIFTYLHHFDLKTCRSVNRVFRSVAWDPAVTKNDIIRLQPEKIGPEEFNYKRMQVLIPSEAFHNNVDFKKKSNFLPERGGSIKHLTFEYCAPHCTETWQDVVKYVSHAEHLVLDLRGYGYDTKDAPDTLSLPNIRALEIHLDETELVPAILGKLNFENLETFCFHPDEDCEFRECAPTELLTLLEKSSSTLKSLRFGYCFDEDFITRCLEKIGPQLEDLRLGSITLGSEFVKVLSSRFPNLASFDFYSCQEDDYPWEVCKELYEKIPSFRKYNFTQEHVEFSQLGFSLQCTRQWHSFQRITKLSVSNDLGNREAKSFITEMTNLVSLDYDWGGSDLKDGALLTLIAESCPRLMYLKVDGLYGLKDVKPLNQLKALLELDLKDLQSLKDHGVAQLSLPELRKLTLSGCRTLTATGIRNILSKCLALRSVKISKQLIGNLDALHTPRSRELVKIVEDNKSYLDSDSDDWKYGPFGAYTNYNDGGFDYDEFDYDSGSDYEY